MVVWTSIVFVPWVYVVGAIFCHSIQQPIDFLVITLFGIVTVCAQAMLASGPIAKGLSQMAAALPGIVKTAQAKMQENLKQHIKDALSPVVADTPAEQCLDTLAESIVPVLKKLIATVAGLLDIKDMTPSFMHRPALMAVGIGFFVTGFLVAFAIPMFTNFIQFHIGIFSIAVLVIHLALIVLAWHAHRFIELALRLVEKLYNLAFGGLLGKMLDDAQLDVIVQMVLDPGGAGMSALGYLAGAVVGTVLSPVSYFTASGQDIENADVKEADDEETENRTHHSPNESSTVHDDAEHPGKAVPVTGLAAGGDIDTVKNFIGALKKSLVMAAYMEFALPETEASQASKDEPRDTSASLPFALPRSEASQASKDEPIDTPASLPLQSAQREDEASWSSLSNCDFVESEQDHVLKPTHDA